MCSNYTIYICTPLMCAQNKQKKASGNGVCTTHAILIHLSVYVERPSSSFVRTHSRVLRTKKKERKQQAIVFITPPKIISKK